MALQGSALALELRQPHVTHLYSKIESLIQTMPHSEVETNSVFINLRKALINISSASNLAFDAIIDHSMITLDHVMAIEGNISMKQRSVNNLSLILIILRLLADLTKVNWDSREPVKRKFSEHSVDSADSSISESSVNHVGIATRRIDHHTVQPKPLQQEIAHKAIILMTKLKSTYTIVQELAHINGQPAKSNNYNSPNDNLSTRLLIDEIDNNCEVILRYLAASNPNTFLDFTIRQLNGLKTNSTTENDFIPFLELYSAIYLNEKYLLEYLKHLRTTLLTIKRPAYRQLLTAFFMKAVNIWISSRPQEFIACSGVNTTISIQTESLFEDIVSSLENSSKSLNTSQASTKHFKSSYRFLALLLTLCPKSLDDFMNNSSSSSSSSSMKSLKTNPLQKLKTFGSSSPGNKKQKVLSTIFKNLDLQAKDYADNLSVLESLDFIVCVSNIASSIYLYDPNAIIVKFSLHCSKLVENVLGKLDSTRLPPSFHGITNFELQLINELRLEFYSSLCVLNPKEIIPQILSILSNERIHLETLNLITSALRTFSSTLVQRESIELFINKLLPLLRKVMTRMGKLIEIGHDYDQLLLTKRSSSANSSGSRTEKSSPTASVHSETFKNTSASTKPDKKESGSRHLLKYHHNQSSNSSSQSSAQYQQQQVLPSNDSVASIGSNEDMLLHGNADLPREIMSNAFEIFKKHPHYYFALTNSESLSPEEKSNLLVKNSSEFLEPLYISLIDSNHKLVQSASSFIFSFIGVLNIPNDFDFILSSYTGSLLMISYLTKSLIDTSPSDPRRKDAVELFVRLFEYRVTLFSVLEPFDNFELVRSLEFDYYNGLFFLIKQAVLTPLCSPDLETYSFIKRAYRALEKELAYNAERNHVIRYNSVFLRTIAHDTSLNTGVVALQKNIRKYFLRFDTPGYSLVTSWLRIFGRWREFANMTEHSSLSQGESEEFRNYAGFLAASSGIFLSEPGCTNGFTQEIKDDIVEKIDFFLEKQIELLWKDDLKTRENAREILALETNPKTNAILTRVLIATVKSFDKKEPLNPKEIVVIDHVIGLFKAILHNSSSITLFSVSVHIIDCCLTLAKVINEIPLLVVEGLKLRIKMAGLFQSLETYSESLVTKSAYKIRNKFLRYSYAWFEYGVSTEYKINEHRLGDNVPLPPGLVLKDEYIYIDLILENVKALAVILDSLLLETTQVMNETESKISKANVFSIYFNTFLKALENFSDSESFSMATRHKVGIISEHIIVCLTNLLKSNVDVGLKYALPIGYNQNCAIRIAFLRVFLSITESFDKKEPKIKESKMKDIFSTLFAKSLENPNMIVAVTRSCPSSDSAGLAASYLSFADSLNQSANLVSFLIQDEIAAGSTYSDLLRRNSFASKTLSAFGRLKGHDYLVQTLRPILTEIRDSKDNFEVEKIEMDTEEAREHLESFMYYLRKLVDALLDSVVNMPIEFKKVCHVISSCVEDKFPDYRLIAVGSFLFLRFFCPVIVNPDGEKIVDVPDKTVQRKFLLVARVLQNMANGSLNTLKWPLLKNKQEELKELNSKLFEFLDQTTKFDESYVFEYKFVHEVSSTDLNFFHTFTYENWHLVRKEYLDSFRTTKDIEVSREFAVIIDEFLSNFGQPTISYGYEIPESITPETHPDLYDLMTKYSSRDLGSLLDNSFVRQGISTDGNGLIVLTINALKDLQGMNPELILYRFFQIASKVWNQKFYLVYDCTAHDEECVPDRLLQLLSKYAPEEMYSNCQGIYFFNISSVFYKKMKRLTKLPTEFFNIGPFPFKFFTVRDEAKLIRSLSLCSASFRIYEDVRVRFQDVSLFQEEQNRLIPISLKVGNEHLQICQVTPHYLRISDTNKEIFPVDVIALKDILSIEMSDTTGVSNELTLKLKSGKTYVLASPKALEIVRLLYFTKNRASDASLQKLYRDDEERTFSGMLGQLLNVILLGLTSSLHEIRGISYNLLASCQEHLGIDSGRRLAAFSDVYFPGDYNSFVISISEYLAQTTPTATFDMITGFVQVYKETNTRQRLSALIYISPWISNVYKYVYLPDAENGASYVSEMVRDLLALSAIDPLFMNDFNTYIWTKLSLEPSLEEILINEVVLTAVDREAEGSDWKSVTSILTTAPTIELCGHVIQRLREISHIPFPNASGSYSVAAHSVWIEITVLVQICVTLFFDSLLFAELFLPDVFYVVTVLVDVGPMDLRFASHQLLLNLLHSFLTDPKLTPENKVKLKKITNHFTSDRARILFGLNRDNNDSFGTDIASFSTKLSAMESLVNLLTQAIEIAGTNNKDIVWYARWNRYVIDSACKKDSVLRGRSFLLLGVLSKTGVTDDLVVKILEMVAEVSTENITSAKYGYLAICTIFSFSRMVLGLLPISPFFTKLFWLSLVVTHSERIPLYQSGLQFLTNVLISMDDKNQFIDYDVIGTLMKSKAEFEDLVGEIESEDQIFSDMNNFDQVLLFYANKGLQVPTSKASSIESLKAFFLIRYKNAKLRLAKYPDEPENKDYVCFLVTLFILLKPNDLMKLLEDANIPQDFILLEDTIKLPKIVADYMLMDSDSSSLTMLQAIRYFKYAEPNEKSMFKFLLLFRFMGQKKPSLILKYYFGLKEVFREKIISSETPVDIVNEIVKLASMAFIQPGYDDDVTPKQVLIDMMDRHKLIGIRSYKFVSAPTFGTAPPDKPRHYRGPIMQQIVSRIAKSKVGFD